MKTRDSKHVGLLILSWHEIVLSHIVLIFCNVSRDLEFQFQKKVHSSSVSNLFEAYLSVSFVYYIYVNVWFSLVDENSSRCSELVRLLGAAVAGIHSMTDEHFGISVVEYMAAGAIPIGLLAFCQCCSSFLCYHLELICWFLQSFSS